MRGKYKKSAKSTGGYGELDDKLLLDVPSALKRAVGKAGMLTDRSSQAFIRQAVLEKLVRLEAMLKANGVQTPTSTDLVKNLNAVRKLPKFEGSFLELQKMVSMENTLLALLQLQERLEALEARDRQKGLASEPTTSKDMDTSGIVLQ
jgi:hypothetical protein